MFEMARLELVDALTELLILDGCYAEALRALVELTTERGLRTDIVEDSNG